MRYAEINKMFTEKVAEYLANGYVINTGSMNGSQGNIASVDLTDGKDIVIVMLDRCHKEWVDGVKLSVGCVKDDYRGEPNTNRMPTIWHSDLDIIFEDSFYLAGIKADDWYVSEDELDEVMKIEAKRWEACYSPSTKTFDDRANKIAVNYVKRQPKCKTAKASEIKVTREERRDGRKKFMIRYKDHAWVLK